MVTMQWVVFLTLNHRARHTLIIPAVARGSMVVIGPCTPGAHLPNLHLLLASLLVLRLLHLSV